MAPAQVLISLDEERSPESSKKLAPSKENGNQLEVTNDTSLRCANNCEDNSFDSEVLLDQHKLDDTGDQAVDILEYSSNGFRLSHAEDPDATECSSSFGDTVSGSEDGQKLNLSDAEVDSRFCHEDSDSAFFDGLDRVFPMRKKKLTVHWRRYIRPLMWRCKWIELRVKEFQSKARKYDGELSLLAHEKQSSIGQVASERSAARSVPLSCQNHRKQAMKRRKRKRAEDTVDIPSYMSHHNLFSYYENRRADADGVSIDDDCGNQVIAADQNNNSADEFGINFEWPVPELGVGDSSFEKVLWNIEILQSRVAKLRNQVDKAVLRNSLKFTAVENTGVVMPVEPPTSSAMSPTVSPENGNVMPVGSLYTPPGHVSEYEVEDFVMPGSTVSSFGDATPLPDIIESTVGLLSAADASVDHRIGDSCEDIEDDILIHNHAAREELQNFEKVTPIRKIMEPAKGEEESQDSVSPMVLAPESDTVPEPVSPLEPETDLAPEEPILTSCSGSDVRVPRNKRKRVERKAGSGRWQGGEKVLRHRDKQDG